MTQVYHSSIVLTQSHSPRRFSFHSETLLSPPDTASTLPLKLQLTRQTTSSNGSTVLDVHDAFAAVGSEEGDEDDVQIRTVLSCDADAMYDFCSRVGAQATSRTQSVCPERESVGV